jgi:hypothetical protein
MTRTEIFQTLTQKADQWATTNPKYNGLPTNPAIPKFSTERDEDGYFHISNDLVSYCNLRNGEIFRIRRNDSDNDWACYSQFYQKGVELGFRIDIPLHKENIYANGTQWEYAELRSPGNEYGQNYNDDVFEWPELSDGEFQMSAIGDDQRDLVKSYYVGFIDEIRILIKEAKVIANANECGLPIGLAHIFNRYTDANGHFWSDFDHLSWNATDEAFLLDAMTTLQGTLMFSMICGVLDMSRTTEIINYASETWQLI